MRGVESVLVMGLIIKKGKWVVVGFVGVWYNEGG